MLHIGKEQAEQCLPFELLVEKLREAFCTDIQVPNRLSLTLPSCEEPRGTALIMPAWDGSRYYGVKMVNIFPDNSRFGLPGLHSVYVLFDGETGAPLGTMDGDVITSRRTAAASALGVSLLAPQYTPELLVVGAGRVASLIAPAMRSVRHIERVRVWDIAAQNAEKCVEQWRAMGIDAEVVSDLEQAVRTADIVSCATLATKPLIRAEWLRPDSHLDLIGSFTPDMTEAEPACFKGAAVWVDTEEAIQKSGDLLNAMRDECLRPGEIKGTLFDLCRNKEPVRSASGRSVFKAVGSALEDLAAAIMIHEAQR